MVEIIIWISIIIAGLGIMVFASQKIVRHVSMLAYGLSVPPFILGMTLVSVGTDLPEIANSIIASVTGHGDLNVGDSIGSIMTQVTLVLGLIPIIAKPFRVRPKRMMLISGLTILGLAIGCLLLFDGYFSRLDAVILFSTWIFFSYVGTKYSKPLSEPVLVTTQDKKIVHGLITLFGILLLLAGATSTVKGITELAAIFDVPEYLISFFGASLGTSLPELVVDITAIREGKKGLAIGDIVGSCMVDATLSISAGPLIAPTLITAYLAVKGSIITIFVIALSIGLIALRKKHDYYSGLALLGLYAGVYYLFFYQ
jgi:cation:H+ antiporter